MSRMASERGSQFCKKERNALRGSLCLKEAVSLCKQMKSIQYGRRELQELCASSLNSSQEGQCDAAF